MAIDIKSWADQASIGDYLTQYEDMTAEETEPGHYVVTQDDSGAVMWQGEAPSEERALQNASEADTGSRCGYSDSELHAARRVLERRNLTLTANDRGLVVAAL